MVCGIRCAFSARNISAERFAPRARPRVVPSIRDGRRVRGSFVERGRGVDVMWRGGSIARCCCFFLMVFLLPWLVGWGGGGGGGGLVAVVVVVSEKGSVDDGSQHVRSSSGI